MIEDYVGRSIGSYTLLSEIGKGGFGSVYLGEHIHRRTKVAVKVLHKIEESDAKERFRAEACTLAKLNHPHILYVFDYGIEDEIPYIATEYAPKGSLREHLPKGKQVSLDTILKYVKQIAEALDYVHSQGVMHCDIKPENILLRDDNEIAITDFGIIGRVASGKTNVHVFYQDKATASECWKERPDDPYSCILAEQTKKVVDQYALGSIAYMAPEQIRGKPVRASDQYSLAIVVYEWLCGTRPFQGDTQREIIEQHLSASPPSLREHMPFLSPAIEEVVLTALAKDPQQRYESIAVFAHALEAATRKHLTKEHKKHSDLEPNHEEHTFHAKESSYHKAFQETDTFPILTKCLAKPYVEKAFEYLPWLERNCLLLYTDAEFTQAEIAEILSLNEKAVHRYLVKASQLWLRAYNSLLEKELGLSLHTKTVSYSEDLLRVKRLIQR